MREAGGIPLLDDMAIFHIHHPAGRLARHFNFVGDDNLGDAGFSQLANDADDLSRDFRVKRRGRLIEQQDLRLHHQRAGDSHTLLLAAG